MSHSYARTGGHWMPCPRKDEAAWRLAIVLRDGFKCVYCDQNLEQAAPKMVTLDHLDPHSNRGSSNQPTNIVTACRPCNSSRKDSDWRAFAGTSRRIRRIERLTATPTNIDLARAFLTGQV